MMKNGNELDLGRRRALFRNMALCQRDTFLLFGEAMGTLAYLDKITDVVFRKVAVQHEAPHRIALPSGAVLRQFKDFF